MKINDGYNRLSKPISENTTVKRVNVYKQWVRINKLNKWSNLFLHVGCVSESVCMCECVNVYSPNIMLLNRVCMWECVYVRVCECVLA